MGTLVSNQQVLFKYYSVKNGQIFLDKFLTLTEDRLTSLQLVGCFLDIKDLKYLLSLYEKQPFIKPVHSKNNIKMEPYTLLLSAQHVKEQSWLLYRWEITNKALFVIDSIKNEVLRAFNFNN